MLSVLLSIAGCTKFVAVDTPRTQIVTASVYSNDGTAKAALNGIYSQMVSNFGFASGGTVSVSFLAGLSADEFTNYSATFDQTVFFTNSLDPNNSILSSSLWQTPYQYIYYANAALEGLASSQSISDSMKKELQGEAKFIRAFCHFYLTNLFGDIPLVLSTDYRVNGNISRISQAQVYPQIIADLQDAQNLLAADFSFSNGERTRPNKWAATALLARVYLYSNDWTKAEEQSSAVINNTSFGLVTDLNNVFKKNSTEAIWQLMPVVPGNNTNEGSAFILTATPNNVAISTQLLAAFDSNDNRKKSWINSITVGPKTFYYPFKYKVQATGLPVTEYSMVLRLAEQYLIRAEARAQQNNITGAQSDLNTIRNRAGLPNTPASTKLAIQDAILRERQLELFSEWGHRWLDLKRTNNADAVLGPVKTPYWQPADILYPIPQTEINNNPKLTQNTGY